METRHNCAKPDEAPEAEWREWSRETRYLFVERLGMEADKFTALDQARQRHAADRPQLPLNH